MAAPDPGQSRARRPHGDDALRRVRCALLGWYATERRDFPWRRTSDPWPVLVSEVMLQQTQASRVVGRFERFMRRYPDPAALATAPAAAVLAEWSGLGYNRRALALRAAAAAIVRDGWAPDVDGLRRLPGVGPYTARAIASLALNEPVGVVDTNVRRWLVRRFGVADRPPALQELADRLARNGRRRRTDEVAAWTHASMEFGATVCRARSPRCAVCPIATGCPSRGRAMPVPVARQPPYRGSDRSRRGALLRALAGADGHAIDANEARAQFARGAEDGVWERVVAGLERDGLIRLADGRLHLGAATIG
jgi:A/G-specific adenine glycosylase